MKQQHTVFDRNSATKLNSNEKQVSNITCTRTLGAKNKFLQKSISAFLQFTDLSIRFNEKGYNDEKVDCLVILIISLIGLKF